MAGKTFSFQQLQIIVGKSNQIEHWLTIAPMETSWMNVTMDKAVVVHMGNCACNLTKDKE